jgi:hypothetical protein
MKRLGTLLGEVGLIIASGAMASVRIDDNAENTTRFTPPSERRPFRL